MLPARHEAPEWYRVYHPEDWDEADAEEIRLTAGLPDGMLPRLHEHHARRRWFEAQHAYRQANPGFAAQELEDLIASAQKRR